MTKGFGNIKGKGIWSQLVNGFGFAFFPASKSALQQSLIFSFYALHSVLSG